MNAVPSVHLDRKAQRSLEIADPLIAEGQELVGRAWHDPERGTKARQRLERLVLLAQEGLVKEAEEELGSLRHLRRQDDLASFPVVASRLGLAVTPLDWVEATYFHATLYNLGWRATQKLRRRRYLFGLVGPVVEERTQEVRRWGIFRCYSLHRAESLQGQLQVPLEVTRLSLQLGKLPQVEEVAIFEQVRAADPILAAMVADRWFMIYQWE